MGFRNPVTSLPADAITSGAFTGIYTVPGTLEIPGSTGVHLELGKLIGGTTHPDGIRLYGPDGVTPLIEISDAGAGGTGLITSTLFRTAPSGKRIEIDSNTNAGEVVMYSGVAGELAPGTLQFFGPGGGFDYDLLLAPPRFLTLDIPFLELLKNTASPGHEAALFGNTISLAGDLLIVNLPTTDNSTSDLVINGTHAGTIVRYGRTTVAFAAAVQSPTVNIPYGGTPYSTAAFVVMSSETASTGATYPSLVGPPGLASANVVVRAPAATSSTVGINWVVIGY